MSKELQPVNVSNIPELLRIAREVEASRQTVLLREDGHDLAVITPIDLPKRRSNRPRPLDEGDAFASLIGTTGDAPPTDAARIHEYLAEAYDPDRP